MLDIKALSRINFDFKSRFSNWNFR